MTIYFDSHWKKVNRTFFVTFILVAFCAGGMTFAVTGSLLRSGVVGGMFGLWIAIMLEHIARSDRMSENLKAFQEINHSLKSH